ncbi:hypothetical protein [Deferrisoma palaeochoriense]
MSEVDRWASPDAPLEARLAAARGLVPLPPRDLMETLAALAGDPDPSVRAAAARTWDEIPANVLQAALDDPGMSPRALEHLARRKDLPRAVLFGLLSHPRLTPGAAAPFADSGDPEVVARLARNQRFLLGCPALGRRLLANPALPPGERSRLESLLGEPAPAADERAGVPSGPEPPADEGADPGDDAGVADETLPPALPPALLDDGAEEPQTEAERENLYQMVRSLSVAQKIKLAMLGSKSARRLLVRDRNKAVVRAVVQSPKIREDEVLAIAQDRTVAEEVIRMILQRRDWMKSYPIRLALCQNPKTPLPRALRLLETLQDRDLRQISKSRNVPSPVSSGATRVLARRGKI